VAVSGDSPERILFLDANLAPADTLDLDPGLDGDAAVAQLLPAPSGTGLYLALVGAAGSSVVEVGQRNGAQVSDIAAAPGKTGRLHVTPKGKNILLLVDGSVLFVDPRGREPDRRVRVCDGQAVGVTVMRAGDRAFVTCAADAVTELNLELRRILQSVQLGEPSRTDGAGGCSPGIPALSLNETVLFVPCAKSGRLLYLDRVTLNPLDSVELGASVRSVHLSRKLNKAVVTFTSRPAVAIVQVRRRETVVLQTSGQLVDLALSGDGLRAYLLLADTGDGTRSVASVDLASTEIVGRVTVPSWAAAITTWPTERTPVMWWRQ
jgi:hypothetical protein